MTRIKRLKILVACEFSGRVRDAFRALGHDAISCDIQPCEKGRQHHLEGDVLQYLEGVSWPPIVGGFQPWDLMIAHPPCTYLSRAGARWWKVPGRAELADAAAEFVYALRDAPIERIAIENPVGQLNSRWRYPDQVIQPHWFGDPFSKATCLWLKNLPPLKPTKMCAIIEHFLPSNTGGGKRGQATGRGRVHGGRDASRTFQGIAEAMAEQWGSLVEIKEEAA